MSIFYLYAYATQQLLFIASNEEELEKVRNAYESKGIMCYSVDFDSMVNNLKIEQRELEESEE